MRGLLDYFLCHRFSLHFGIGAGHGVTIVRLRHKGCTRIPDAVAAITALLTLARFLRLLLVAVAFTAFGAATTATTATATTAATLAWLFGGGGRQGC